FLRRLHRRGRALARLVEAAANGFPKPDLASPFLAGCFPRHAFPILSPMTRDNDPNQEPPIFSAVLTPHRSLSPAGFVIFMAVLGGLSFLTGMVFLFAGA